MARVTKNGEAVNGKSCVLPVDCSEEEAEALLASARAVLHREDLTADQKLEQITALFAPAPQTSEGR